MAANDWEFRMPSEGTPAKVDTLKHWYQSIPKRTCLHNPIILQEKWMSEWWFEKQSKEKLF